MPQIRVRVEGLPEFNRALKGLDAKLLAGLDQAHGELAEGVVRQQRATVPTETAQLRSLIEWKRHRKGSWSVSTGEEGRTPYLGQVEFGGRRNAPSAFVRRAAAAAESRYQQTVEAAIRRAMR